MLWVYRTLHICIRNAPTSDQPRTAALPAVFRVIGDVVAMLEK